MDFEKILQRMAERHKEKRAEFQARYLVMIPVVPMICILLGQALKEALDLREDPRALDHYLDAAVLAAMAVQELEAIQKTAALPGAPAGNC